MNISWMCISAINKELDLTIDFCLYFNLDTLAIMIGTVAVTGSIALVSLGLNCVLLTLLIKNQVCIN